MVHHVRLGNALRGLPVDRPPVWFMRQAGRYLPEYRAVRERVSFLELCRDADLACEVTIQPVDRFGLDANNAIIAFDTGVGLTVGERLTYNELIDDQAAAPGESVLDVRAPELKAGSYYNLVLPIEAGGILEGLTDGTGYIQATSHAVPASASIFQFLGSIPQAIEFIDLDEVFRFSGLSLDAILAALQSSFDSLVGVDRELLGRQVDGELLVYEER